MPDKVLKSSKKAPGKEAGGAVCRVCGAEACWQAAVKLWPVMTPMVWRTDNNALLLLTRACFCSSCGNDIKAGQFMTPAFRENIRAWFDDEEKGTPDFDSAEMYFIDIIDEPLDILDYKSNGGGSPAGRSVN
jgi:hypothetical protein